MAKPMTVEEFAAACAAALGPRLQALLLYGSRASGAVVPSRSDVNTLLICDLADEAFFAALEPVVVHWCRGGQPAPLILSDAEWRESADAFPIEYEDIRHVHRLLAGRDPWQGIVVRREDLRRQLEHELKGKLVRLRQAYAAFHGDRRRLAAFVAGSASGFRAMLRAVLRLAGGTVPAQPEALVQAAAVVVGFPADAVTGGGEHFPSYLAAVARTAEFVHRLEQEPGSRERA